MEKNFVDIFAELAPEGEQSYAIRIAKLLEKNGIDSMTKLMASSDNAIYEIKGIGDRAMHIVGVVKTKEFAKRTKKTDAYEKLKGKQVPTSFKDYAVKAGSSVLGAAQFEQILKHAGIDNMDIFLKTSQEDLSQIRGIGPKRLQQCILIKSMYASKQKKSSKRK